MKHRSICLSLLAMVMGLIPLSAWAQSNEVRSAKVHLDMELAALSGNLEVTTGPMVDQMRTRVGAALDSADRMNTYLGMTGGEAQAASELDSLDREVLLLQGMLEGSYINGRDQMLQHIRTSQAYIANLRSLLGARSATPVVVQPVVVQPVQPTGPTAMEAGSFANLLQAVSAQSFSDGRLAVIRSATNGNHFTVAQVSQLVALMDFGDDKIETVVACWPYVIDPQNVFMVYSQFDFDSDVEELRMRLGL